MSPGAVWDQQLDRLSHLTFLDDKPEETIETTLKALWLTAVGTPKSVEAAASCNLPPLSSREEKELVGLVEKRLAGVPLAHITGRQQFIGVELFVGPNALIPRKETEILGWAALNVLKQWKNPRRDILLMDICTGAGNLVVSLAMKDPRIRGYASDLSMKAVKLAKENIDFYQLEKRVEVREGDLFTPYDTPEFHNQVDLLLCNPPYISTGRVKEMDLEIAQYEPALAFDGGVFGVKILYAFLREAPRFLKPDGWLAVEVGSGQGDAVIKQLKKTFSHVEHAADKNGNIRVVLAQM